MEQTLLVRVDFHILENKTGKECLDIFYRKGLDDQERRRSIMQKVLLFTSLERTRLLKGHISSTDCAGGKYYIGGVKSDFRKSKCFFCSPSSCYRPPFPKDRCRLGREPREERTRRSRGGEGAQQERTREMEREREEEATE